MKLISCCVCGRVADPGPLWGWVSFDRTAVYWPPDAYACLECFNATYRLSRAEQDARLSEIRLRVATTRALEGNT